MHQTVVFLGLGSELYFDELVHTCTNPVNLYYEKKKLYLLFSAPIKMIL